MIDAIKELFRSTLPKIKVQKYKPVFVTVDGKEHEGPVYNWIIPSRIKCSPSTYIMYDVSSDGYLKDKDGVMYILSNIISIDWQIAEEKEIEDKYSEYQVYINKLKE
jgi:hypothetical protein